MAAEMVREESKAFLNQHQVPRVIRGIIAGLMVEKPDDHMTYIKEKLKVCQSIGPEETDWETFVYTLHPYRDELRLKLLHDYSKYYIEHLRSQSVPEEVIRSTIASRNSEYDPYKPEVFQLTEMPEDSKEE